MRFAFQRHPLDLASYPPTRNGRAPFVPLGVNSCPALVMAPGAPPAERFDWCYNSAADLNASAIDTGTKCKSTLVVFFRSLEKLLDRHGDGLHSLGRRIAA